MTTLTAASPTFGGGTMMAGGGPIAPAPAGAAFSPADALRIVRQRLLFIILIGGFFSGLGIGGVLFWYVNYPGYAAEALIKVESLQPVDPMGDLGAERVDNQAIEREIQNQAYLVTRPSVLDNALLDPTLRDTTWFREASERAKTKNENIHDLLEDMLTVSPIRESNLIRVSATWRIPGEVHKIVNVVVQEYLEAINTRSRNQITQQMEEMSKELEIARQSLNTKSDEIKNYIQSSKYSALGIDVDQQVASLQDHATDLELLVANLRSIWEEMKSMRPEDIPIDQQMQELIQGDPKIQRLEYAVQEARRNLDLVSERFMENHKMRKAAQLAYDTAFQNLESERAQRIVDYQRRRLEEARRNYMRTSNVLVQVTENLNRAKGEQRDKDNKLALLDGLLDEKKLLTTQYQHLLDKKNRLEIQQRQEKKVRIDIADYAVPPKRISSPSLKTMLPLSVVGGFALAIGLAVLMDLSDKSVRTPRDVSRTQLPVLGTIPSTDDDLVVFDHVETACLDAPHSIVAEAFRNLRANLFFSAPAEQQGVILVTSPSGDNGKTTIASNLAISIALSGRRVLLIDANFRRAALPTIFPNIRTEGLSNILIGQGQLRDYTVQTQVPGLDVLGAGPIPPNPAELLGSSYLRDVIVDARARYDQVIFDGPPVLLVSDAMVLAGAVDGCLLVCEYRRTSRGALQRSRSNLEAINARIFGAVLNKVEGRRGGYFRKTYREFYEYQEPDDDIGERPKLDLSDRTTDVADIHADAYTDATVDNRGYDAGPGGGTGEPDDTIADEAADDVVGLDELEDEPPMADAATTTETVEPQPPAKTPQDAVAPDVPTVDAGSELDLGSLPDLSDLDQLDIRGDQDIETRPASREDDAIDTGRSDEEALDLENLADEMEELEGEDFRIDDQYDLGDDDSGEDAPEDRR